MWEGYGPPKNFGMVNPALLRPQREVKKIDNRFNCVTCVEQFAALR